MALSRALKGSASAWMAQVNYAGMDWGAFRKMFLAQYDTFETPAGATMRINGGKPREGESMPSYANRVLASFTSLYTKMSTEQIAIASTLAHCVQIDPRLQRVAFTTKIDNRASLQKELMAFGFRKRSATADGKDPKATDIKKMRSGVACFSCGKEGHKATDCPRRQGATRMLGPKPSTSGDKRGPPQKPVTCFKCGEDGHIAPQCKKENGKSHPRVPTERRINLCSIAPVTAELAESGEVYDFCFDTGAECSLIKESVANKFSGKRFENLTRLIGLGNANVMSSVQILSQVIILGHRVEILFHVVPDEHLSSSIFIGRDLIAQGFSVEISANNFILKRDKMIKICEVGKKIDNFNGIDTDIDGPDKGALINLLNGFSESFVIGTPTGRINTGELLIKLIDPNRTVQRRPYRLSPNERQTVRDKVSELLSAGIIRPSCSPFASPIILVNKKDGSDRLCVDYRELNSNTVPDRYPLPLISDQIQRLSGAQYFTTLDMASGFHQIPIHEDSIEKTAFVTPDGQYEYLSMPLGLRNAPSYATWGTLAVVSAIKAINYCVNLFGAPSRIIADQGRCFAGSNFRDFCKTHNIDMHLIATAAELNNSKSWQESLESVQLALNCTVNLTTKHSPLELLIGKVARPMSLSVVNNEDEGLDLSDIREQVTQAFDRNAAEDKTRFDSSKAEIIRFSVGNYVLIENHERNQTKLDAKFRGLYKIVEVLPNDRYRLKSINGNRVLKYAHERLRLMPDSSVPIELDIRCNCSDTELTERAGAGNDNNARHVAPERRLTSENRGARSRHANSLGDREVATADSRFLASQDEPGAV
ncbi:uncharacterized protein LOC143210757 [Lasioglossum baleicum]|uniref:uncharacterized protein LOC143210757 n=1 Tax=Lasioglossum baleicum TaxID=434251 RepID=UPI003FCC2F6E